MKNIFDIISCSLDKRGAKILEEFNYWQNYGEKMEDFNDFNFRWKSIVGVNGKTLIWNIGNEYYARAFTEETAPFTREQYEKTIQAVYSFMNDRPEYYRFRNLEGMYNPLRILLFELLYAK